MKTKPATDFSKTPRSRKKPAHPSTKKQEVKTPDSTKMSDLYSSGTKSQPKSPAKNFAKKKASDFDFRQPPALRGEPSQPSAVDTTAQLATIGMSVLYSPATSKKKEHPKRTMARTKTTTTPTEHKSVELKAARSLDSLLTDPKTPTTSHESLQPSLLQDKPTFIPSIRRAKKEQPYETARSQPTATPRIGQHKINKARSSSTSEEEDNIPLPIPPRLYLLDPEFAGEIEELRLGGKRDQLQDYTSGQSRSLHSTPKVKESRKPSESSGLRNNNTKKSERGQVRIQDFQKTLSTSLHDNTADERQNVYRFSKPSSEKKTSACFHDAESSDDEDSHYQALIPRTRVQDSSENQYTTVRHRGQDIAQEPGDEEKSQVGETSTTKGVVDTATPHRRLNDALRSELSNLFELKTHKIMHNQ